MWHLTAALLSEAHHTHILAEYVFSSYIVLFSSFILSNYTFFFVCFGFFRLLCFLYFWLNYCVWGEKHCRTGPDRLRHLFQLDKRKNLTKKYEIIICFYIQYSQKENIIRKLFTFLTSDLCYALFLYFLVFAMIKHTQAHPYNINSKNMYNLVFARAIWQV